MTHTANFSMTALEQLSSEQLVTWAVASHVTRFQCVQLLFALDTNRLYSINQHYMLNKKTILKNKLLIFQDNSSIMWSEIFSDNEQHA